MSHRIEIAPSILAADFTRLGDQVREAEAAGADRIHIDVMDGRFVPNITMGPMIVAAVRRVTQLPLDVHLMIVEPDHLLEEFAQAGATRIFVHWETCPNLHRTLSAIEALGCAPGVAINPHTPATFLSEIIHKISAVIVMTVNPGFGGQQFLPETLPKMTMVRRMFGDRAGDIVVDGGINIDTINQVVRAGANILVAGSVVFTDKHSVQVGLQNLRQALQK
ncbi:MAG: ribulose-phosphate 3-epimerase [Chloroflexi bacterium]|nr:ribulose-phosphate 3-epimerase [Chloroflexota bacterium]